MRANVTTRTWLLLGVGLSLTLALIFAGLGIRPAAQEPPSTAGGVQSTTLNDQVDLALTIYNSNIALVRDVRDVRLPLGTFDLRFQDIAASVNPATVHFRSLTEPGRLRLLEQNYEYDLLDPEKLLRKYVGRDVTLVRSRQIAGTTSVEEIQARLLAFNTGPVWQIGDEIVTGLHADYMRFPTLPDNLYDRPTLVWTLGNEGAEAHRVEASCLTGNLAWSADYVLTVDRDDSSADLDGWVTLKNESGTAFTNASLQFVAGDLNRVRQDYARRREMPQAVAAPSESAFQQEAFSEYHLYSLDRRTSVKNHETKQLSLLTGSDVPTSKHFVVEGQSGYYRNRQHPGTPLRDPVKVFYRLRNDAASGLGMPMPAGVVRVYQADVQGRIHFAGEDRIAHTPKDETLSLHVGNAFDVVCERIQTDFRKIGTSTYETAFEITLRNHKPTPIRVELNEPIGGTWCMLESSHEATKTSAWATRFDVPVPANDETVVRYRVVVRW